MELHFQARPASVIVVYVSGRMTNHSMCSDSDVHVEDVLEAVAAVAASAVAA